MNALSLLGVILVAAKALGYTTLPWLTVTAPFWIPLAIALAVAGVGLVGMLLAALFK